MTEATSAGPAELLGTHPFLEEGVYTLRITGMNLAIIEPGIIEYEDGSKFEGGIKKGVREGKGTLYYAPGDVYEGTWHNNMRYEGEYVNGKMHGRGVMIYPNQNKYEGEWQNDLRHGKGVVTYPIGDIFEGQFVAGKRHGESFVTYANGRKHQAEWKDDQLVPGSMKFMEVVEMKPAGEGASPGPVHVLSMASEMSIGNSTVWAVSTV